MKAKSGGGKKCPKPKVAVTNSAKQKAEQIKKKLNWSEGGFILSKTLHGPDTRI